MIDVRYYIRRPNGSSAASVHLRDIGGELVQFVRDTERGARTVAAQAAGTYLIGDGRHGLRHYPKYKYFSRKQAFGKTFVSDRQRRYVMARIREGSIDPGVPHRTGRLQRGWSLAGKGTDVIMKNTEPHVLPVMGDDVQSRHERLVGWRMISDIITTNMDGALKASAQAVEEYYEKKVKG